MWRLQCDVIPELDLSDLSIHSPLLTKQLVAVTIPNIDSSRILQALFTRYLLDNAHSTLQNNRNIINQSDGSIPVKVQ